jgi:hypothetical protein
MTDENHELWEALAVGHAMRALEPADDAQFREHVATCAQCAAVLAEAEGLMESLAMAAEPAPPPPALRERVLAISRDSGARVAPVVGDELGRRRSLRSRLTPVTRWVVVAAAVSAIASSGLTYALVHNSAHFRIDYAASPGYQCLTDATCQRMPLVSPDKRTIGAVVLEKGKAYIMSPELAKSGATDQYVVWTGDATGKMTAVEAFRVTGDGIYHALEKVPSLSGVTAMAISREVRGPFPDKPSGALGIAAVPRGI